MTSALRTILGALSPAGSRGRLMIFPYHRVVNEEDPMVPGSPSAARFARQLQRVRKYCNPLRLEEAVRHLISGTLPPRAVALTFDDGYANNLDIAAPLLKKYDIPATLFVAVDALERGIMWNDLIIEAVRKADGKIDTGDIGLGCIDLDNSNRISTAKRLIGEIQYLPTRKRLELAEALHARASRTPPMRQMLRPDQLKDLRSFGIDIGAHTVNHPILRLLDDSAARSEINDSRTWIRDVTGQEPVLFAYPNGKRGGDYDQRDVEIVQSLGFLAAVRADWGCATRDSSLFELPRFKPWEDTDAGFGARLCKTVARTYI